MTDFTMVVPSYWGRAESEVEPGIVFDHPTRLNEEGTLGRLLESLEVLGVVDGRIVVIAVANEPEITEQVRLKVEGIIAPFKNRYNIVTLSQATLDKVRDRLAGRGVSEQGLELINLDNYAAVRNMCSLAGVLNAGRYTIFIDDDEVFTDPDFLKKIEEYLGREFEGRPIEALAGYYLQPETYHLDESRVPDWRRPFWNNTRAMNEAFEVIIGKGPRLKPTPFVFGGNMAVSLKALKTAPFDPRITRGEDIDFLLNLRIQGIPIILDRELSITHLPPPSNQKAWKKVREDAIRFLYERKKVQDHDELVLADLQPYPGIFLGDDLEERIIRTNELLIEVYREQGDEESIRECKKTVEMTKKKLWRQVETRQWLAELTNFWQELCRAAEGLGIPD